jgi:hypothetical protein
VGLSFFIRMGVGSMCGDPTASTGEKVICDWDQYAKVDEIVSDHSPYLIFYS